MVSVNRTEAEAHLVAETIITRDMRTPSVRALIIKKRSRARLERHAMRVNARRTS